MLSDENGEDVVIRMIGSFGIVDILSLSIYICNDNFGSLMGLYRLSIWIDINLDAYNFGLVGHDVDKLYGPLSHQ